MDISGFFYVIFKNSRSIYKYDKEGKIVSFINESDDITKTCKLYDLYITKGRSFLYVIGSNFYNGQCDSFIDKYDAFKGTLISRDYIFHSSGVLKNDEKYTFTDIRVCGEYIYITTPNYIEKANIKMIPIWKQMFAYNEFSGKYNKLKSIEFDNSSFNEFIYFCEDLYDTYGFAYGKMKVDGTLVWKITSKENSSDLDFNLSVDNEFIYTYNRENIKEFIDSVLSIDNNSLLMETRNGKLIKITQYNKEIFNDDDYYGSKILYGEELDKNIPLDILVPLLNEKKKYLLDDNQKMLCMEKENEALLQDNSYKFYQLIADLTDESIKQQPLLKASNNGYILTSNGHRIKTKQPYQTKRYHEIIGTKSNNEPIISKYRDELSMKKDTPINYYLLLADYFKFYTGIITKRNNDFLITKQKHNYICKKNSPVYKYLLRKIKDTNLMVEFMIQNNVLDTMYPNYIEDLKHHTQSILTNIQDSKCPSYYDLKAISVSEYSYDANTLYINENGMFVLLCKNLPFVKKKPYKPLNIRSMADMVEDETIHPFLLFLNGKVIKWSDMTIVRDWHESFIIIENSKENKITNIDCIVYPCAIHYGEDSNIDDNNDTGLYFDKDGLFTTNPSKIKIRMEVLDTDIVSTTQYMNDNKNYIELDLEKNKLSTERNIFIFNNGLFSSDNRYYLQNTGYNIYGYGNEYKEATFKTFFYIKGLDSKNIIFKIPNSDQVKEDAKNIISGSSDNYLYKMNQNFDFHFSRNKSYDRNISEAIDYISEYDISLLMNYYKKQSRFVTLTYTGKQVQERSSNGLFTTTRFGHGKLDSFVIVFHNGLLYENYHQIKYNNRYITIPTNGILDDDIIEIVCFSNICNKVFTINILSDNKEVFIPDFLRYNNFSLFDNNNEVIFDYANKFDKYGSYTNTKISFSDIDNYNKSLQISSNRRFSYQRFTENKVGYTLNEDFKLCQNISQYMIFVNHKKINKEDWSIIASNNITLSIMNHPNIETVEVFYIPEILDESNVEYYHTKFGHGDIQIDNLDIPFDKDVFFIFVDGKKQNMNNIENISRDSLRLVDKKDNINNLCICKLMQTDLFLKELLSYQELWSNNISALTNDTFKKLFDKIK